jgi:hypothetical protein
VANGSVSGQIANGSDHGALAPPVTGPARVAGEIKAPTHGEIAALAYTYWEARGSPAGSPCEDWFRAERELTLK